jgi:RNA polymerase sigma-70 factor (ECF subfamily)
VIATDPDCVGARLEHHRRELQLHCYRLLGSRDDAEEIVQETFVRAWAARDRSDGAAWYRAWLYRIATNACFDLLRARRRRPWLIGLPPASFGPTLESRTLDPPSTTPHRDPLRGDDPEAATLERETIELAYVAARQTLPPRQRAVFVLRDVLGWTAAETAHSLDLSVAAANSALQRARATFRRSASNPLTRSSELTKAEADEVRRFLDACERYDVDEMIALIGHGIRRTAQPDVESWPTRRVFAA